MPPTIQSGRPEAGSSSRRKPTTEKKSELVCRIKYNNTLPDIPFDPKFITYPFESTRFVSFNPTSLERTYKHDLLTEHDLGVTIDLINPETYSVNENAQLDPEDEKLLEDDIPGAVHDKKRSRQHNTVVSWMRKTEYISTEYNRFTQKAEKAESRVGYNIKQKFSEDDLYRDRDSQINSINKTFDMAKEPIKQHHSKPNVKPVEILPVYPDWKMWQHPCAQVIFDTDPAPQGRSTNVQMEEMSQAMIRGMVDEEGAQFVAYFLPVEETREKRKRDAEQGVSYEDDDEYEYLLTREYNWNVKNKSTSGYEESFFFVIRDDGVYYNELETKVRLNKRRKLGGAVNKSRLVVRHRELNSEETKQQNDRLEMLEVAQEVEEEDEEEEQPTAEDPDADAIERMEDDTSEKNAASDAGSARDSSPAPSSVRSRSASPRSGASRASSSSRSPSRSPSRSSRSSSRSASRSRSVSPAHSDSDVDTKRKDDAEAIFGSDSSDDD